MGSYQIEAEWECESGECPWNLGRYKKCVRCGRPRTEKCKERSPRDRTRRAAEKDPERLRHALGGRDLECWNCKSSKWRISGECAVCGSTRNKEERPQNTLPPQRRFSVSYDDKPLTPASHQSRNAGKLSVVLIVLGVLISLAIVIAVGIFLSRTRDLQAKVSAVEWTHTVRISRYQAWQNEGFKGDIPKDAKNIKEKGERFHHEEEVDDGFEMKPCMKKVKDKKKTCTKLAEPECTKNFNGYLTCDDEKCEYKEREVKSKCPVPKTKKIQHFEKWYTWTVWAWGWERDVPATGKTLETWWPSKEELAPKDKLAEGEKENAERLDPSYSVTFVQGDERHTYKPKTLTDFEKFPIGSTHKLRVGILHGVEVLP